MTRLLRIVLTTFAICSLPAAQADTPATTAQARVVQADFNGSPHLAVIPPPARAGESSVSPASPASLQWLDGTIAYTYTVDCITGVATGTGSYTGYYGANDATLPRVGDIYYAHVVVAGLSTPCSGGFETDIEFIPPPNTQFAITAQTPVYCFIKDGNNPAQAVSDCSQNPQVGYYGYTFDPISRATWPIVIGRFVEVQIPLISTTPLNGIAGNDQQTAPVWAIDGIENQWAAPTQWVWVAPAAVDDDLIFKSGFE